MSASLDLIDLLTRLARACADQLPPDASALLVSVDPVDTPVRTSERVVLRRNGEPVQVVPPESAKDDLRQLRDLKEHVLDEALRGQPGPARTLEAKWVRRRERWHCSGFSIGESAARPDVARSARKAERRPWRIGVIDKQVVTVGTDGSSARLTDVLRAVVAGDLWPWSEDGPETLVVRTIGPVAVPSGRLLVWSPVNWETEQPVVLSVPAGTHEVEIVESTDPIATVLRVRATEIVQWGRFGHPDPAQGEKAWQHGVSDSRVGMVSFADQAVAERLDATWCRGEASTEELTDVFTDIEQHGRTHPWGAAGPAVVSALASVGGPFPIYGGVDADRRLAAVVVPFVLDEAGEGG